MKHLNDIKNYEFAKVIFMRENGKIVGFKRVGSDEIVKLSKLKKSDYVDEIRVVAYPKYSRGGKYKRHLGDPITVVFTPCKFSTGYTKTGYTKTGAVSASYVIGQTYIRPVCEIEDTERERARIAAIIAENEAVVKAEKAAKAKAKREAAKVAEAAEAAKFSISVKELRLKYKELASRNSEILANYEAAKNALFEEFEGKDAMHKIVNRVKFARLVNEKSRTLSS
jgi:hypothetical protein